MFLLWTICIMQTKCNGSMHVMLFRSLYVSSHLMHKIHADQRIFIGKSDSIEWTLRAERMNSSGIIIGVRLALYNRHFIWSVTLSAEQSNNLTKANQFEGVIVLIVRTMFIAFFIFIRSIIFLCRSKIIFWNFRHI